MNKKLAFFSLFAALSMAGCRDEQVAHPLDLKKSMDDMGTQNGDDMSTSTSGCASGYESTTIAEMRAAAAAANVGQCAQLGMKAPVIAMAVNKSSATGTLALQDQTGGDYSGIIAKCSTNSSSHKCSVLDSVATSMAGHAVVVSGFYTHSLSGKYENFYITDVAVTDSGTPSGNLPAAAQVTLANVRAMSDLSDMKLYYQKVSVDLGGDTLKVYEYGPAALKSSFFQTGDLHTCPSTYGFGLAPSSVSGAGPSCTPTLDTTGKPDGNTVPQPISGTPSSEEILVSTTFYNNFKASTDCACSKTVLSSSDTFTALSGILDFDSGSTLVLPTTDADLAK